MKTEKEYIGPEGWYKQIFSPYPKGLIIKKGIHEGLRQVVSWFTKDMSEIKIKDLTNDHLIKIYNMVRWRNSTWSKHWWFLIREELRYRHLDYVFMKQ